VATLIAKERHHKLFDQSSLSSSLAEITAIDAQLADSDLLCILLHLVDGMEGAQWNPSAPETIKSVAESFVRAATQFEAKDKEERINQLECLSLIVQHFAISQNSIQAASTSLEREIKNIFDQIEKWNLPKNENTSLHSLLLSSIECCLKSGMSRMKVFVIFFPMIIDQIQALQFPQFKVKEEGEEGEREREEGSKDVQLKALILQNVFRSIESVCHAGNDPEFFLQSLKTIIFVLFEDESIVKAASPPILSRSIEKISKRLLLIAEQFVSNHDFRDLLDIVFAIDNCLRDIAPDVGREVHFLLSRSHHL